jgi:tRNA threonylcarbamoyl adenosine modification protein YeaZ
MRLLAIDTALAACSVAVFDTEAGIIASESNPMVRGHAEALMPLVARMMRWADTQFSDLDRIAVTTGPGSFTGLRVGVAAARGLALAAAKPAIGITTLDAFAAPARAVAEPIPVLAVIDARNAQVYMQAFDADGRARAPARLALAREAFHAVPPGAVHIVGTAATLVASLWPTDQTPPAKIEAKIAPDIEWVARLGAVAEATGAAPKPLYLRAPDARPQDGARIARQ